MIVIVIIVIVMVDFYYSSLCSLQLILPYLSVLCLHVLFAGDVMNMIINYIMFDRSSRSCSAVSRIENNNSARIPEYEYI